MGGFHQLPRVNCRLGHKAFKDSRALHELCDGNQLNLPICRRSDDTLFNMVAPKNIKNITKYSFGYKFTDRQIAYTNAKRIQINKKMMDIIVKKKKNKPFELKKQSYDTNPQDMLLLPDMPVIARINSTKYDISNNK